MSKRAETDEDRLYFYIAPHVRLACFKVGVTRDLRLRLRNLQDAIDLAGVRRTRKVKATAAKSTEAALLLQFARFHFVRELRDACSEWLSIQCLEALAGAAETRLGPLVPFVEEPPPRRPGRVPRNAAPPLSTELLLARARHPYRLERGTAGTAKVLEQYRWVSLGRTDVPSEDNERSPCPRVMVGDVWTGLTLPIGSRVRVVGTFDGQTTYQGGFRGERCPFAYCQLEPFDGHLYAIALGNRRFGERQSRLSRMPEDLWWAPPTEEETKCEDEQRRRRSQADQEAQRQAERRRRHRWQELRDSVVQSAASTIGALNDFGALLRAAIAHEIERADALKLWLAVMAALKRLQSEVLYELLNGPDEKVVPVPPRAEAIIAFCRHVSFSLAPLSGPSPSLGRWLRQVDRWLPRDDWAVPEAEILSQILSQPSASLVEHLGILLATGTSFITLARDARAIARLFGQAVREAGGEDGPCSSNCLRQMSSLLQEAARNADWLEQLALDLENLADHGGSDARQLEPEIPNLSGTGAGRR
jgi:hypothetical protein